MEHSINTDKCITAQMEDVKIYVSSYEVTRERKFSFLNCSEGDMYMTDNGTYPAYLRLKGHILRSECKSPCVVFEQFANDNVQFFLNMDGIFFNAVKLKNYSLVTDTESDMIKCDIVFCCISYMEET